MLTPKQAFEAIKVLYPETTHIDCITNKCGLVRWINGVAYFCAIDAEIHWGKSLPFYPPIGAIARLYAGSTDAKQTVCTTVQLPSGKIVYDAIMQRSNQINRASAATTATSKETE